MFLDGGTINMFVPHRWQQVLHLRFAESLLGRLPSRAELLRDVQ
jgi:hypothetical protein